MAEDGAQGRSWQARWGRDALIAVVAVVATLGIQAVLGGDDGDDDGAVPSTTAPPVSPSTSEPDEPTTTAGEPADSFEDGFHLVGEQIRTGRYIATGLTGSCNWERYADIEGNQPSAGETQTGGQAVVDILPEDRGFRSANCGVWEAYTRRTAPPATQINDGDWVIGDQIEPGTYQSDVARASRCVWTHASGFSHAAQEIIDSHTTIYLGNAPPAVVTLEPGQRFSSQNCEPWTKVG